MNPLHLDLFLRLLLYPFEWLALQVFAQAVGKVLGPVVAGAAIAAVALVVAGAVCCVGLALSMVGFMLLLWRERDR